MMKTLDNKGNAAIVLCLVLTALLGFSAFVIDIGMVFANKIKLSNALDSAALAAALELPKGDTEAYNVAMEYLEKNSVDTTQTSIAIGADHKSVEIGGYKNVKHLFAPIIGIKDSNVSNGTKGAIAPAKSVKGGIRPFAVEAYDYTYGDLVTLKENAGNGYHGNYGIVALGGSGTSIFRANALYGYSGTLSVGDYINTEPGDMAGVCNEVKKYVNSEYSTFSNFPRNSIRLWTIPLVDTLSVDGRESVLVTGFAMFYVEDVSNNSGKIEISGRFVRYVIKCVTDSSLKDTGAYGAKLVK